MGEDTDLEDAALFSFMPGVRILNGAGVSKRLTAELSSLDGERPLLVTDSGVVEAGILGRITDLLSEEGIDYAVFDEVHSNPRLSDVTAAHQRLNEERCDCVVAVGGGSSIDTAKAVATLATNGGDVPAYRGIDQIDEQPLPIAAIPTTVGTGSEVTQSMVISDEANDEKIVVISELLGPDVALLDPTLLDTLPAAVVASTGIDSFTQAVEAYISSRANPVTRALSQSAVELLANSLRSAVATGDRESLEQMQVATTMQGIALTNSGLGLVHGLSNTVGGYFDTNHGATNAALLPPVLEFNEIACREEYVTLASTLGLDTDGLSSREAAATFVTEVERLLEDVGLDVSLETLGVERAAFEPMAEDALTHVDSRSNPRQYTKEDLVELYEEAY